MMMIAARVATGRAVRPEGEGNQLLHMSSKLRCRCFWDRAEGPECLGMRKGARGKGPSLKKKLCLCLILEVRVCMSACLGVCISTQTDMYIYVTTDQYTLKNSIDVKKVQNDKEKIIR